MPEMPLSGIDVLDMTWSAAGPMAARVLADFGAQVIRVESATRVDLARHMEPFVGGIVDLEHSGIFGNYNAGKLGMSLNLTTEDGRQIARQLADRSDILMESFSPGIMQRWGLSYENLSARNPRLIMLSTSLMGGSGPLSRTGGYGNAGSALSGIQHVVGWPDRVPFGPYGPYTDSASPRFSLALILGALDYRRRTGHGCYLDLSQVECGVELQAPEVAEYFATGRVALRAGNTDREMAPHGVFETQPTAGLDSHWVAIAVQDDDQWQRLVQLMGDPPELTDSRYATAAGRLANRSYLDTKLADWVRSQTAPAVERLLQEHKVAAHVALSSNDAALDTQLAARGHFIELDHPLSGRTVVEGPRYQLSETPAVIRSAAPLLGQHTDQILREILGYRPEEIAKLHASAALD